MTPYDRIAAQYDELFGDNNPYYRSVNRCEREIFQKWVERPVRREPALDLGCGTGFHTEWLVNRGFQTLAIDKSEQMVRIAQAKSLTWKEPCEFQVMDILELGRVPENYFKVILCFGSVMNHLSDWKSVAGLVGGRLVHGGMFFYSYDNIDGIDVLARVLLRQFAGYTDAYVREIVLGRLRAKIRGEGFNNHWRVHTAAEDVCIPLRYERTAKWQEFLDTAGLRLSEIRGTHVFDCFDRGLLQASAGANVTGVLRPSGLVRRILSAVDQVLARRLYRIAAHVVGVAVKD